MRKISFITTCFIVLFAGVISSYPAYAQNSEKILSFCSDIKVHSDSTMTVTETIKVVSAGEKIKHGIYRDFPTRYKDFYGNAYVVGFDVVSVSRDGRDESFHMERLSNGQRVYIGDKDSYVSSGEHTYTLVYQTNRQLGYFEDYDELYWNVTGNGWEFPILQASATVELPDGAAQSILDFKGFTGYQGSKETAVRVSEDSFNRSTFQTSRSLNPQEGLTIVVSWPKGYVQEPTSQEKFGYFLQDNRGVMIGIVGFLIVLLYYLFFWYRVGIDPNKGTIIPLFYPPDNFSPESVRYVSKMKYDNKVFTSAIIDMAVKGYLTIKESDGMYTLERTGKEEGVLSPEQKAISQVFFGSSKETIALKNTNHAKICKAIEKLTASLQGNFEKAYFFTNTQYFIPGLLLSILCILMTGVASFPVAVVIYIWLSVWTFGVFALGAQAWNLWSNLGSAGSFSGAVSITLFAIPFFAFEIFGIGMLMSVSSVFNIVILLMIVFVNFLFYHLLKAPTLLGRKILDKVEGFKMYLSAAEKDRLNVLNPVEKTPELFEKYLPYALALDVEQQWAEQFAEVLSEASYSPDWYSGRSWNRFNAGQVASNFGNSFSNAIASSSTAPGSSSGSGGRGSSGGGGGGGGGGGW